MKKEELAEQYGNYIYEGYKNTKTAKWRAEKDFIAGFSAKEEQIEESLKTLQSLVDAINNSPPTEQIFKNRDLDRLNNKIEILKSLL